MRTRALHKSLRWPAEGAFISCRNGAWLTLEMNHRSSPSGSESRTMHRNIGLVIVTLLIAGPWSVAKADRW